MAALVASVLASTRHSTIRKALHHDLRVCSFLRVSGLNAFAQHVWMLIVGRMLLGFGIGAPIRVALQLRFCGESTAIMIIIGAIFLPDSPSSLIERGLGEKAKKELIKIRGTTDIEQEFEDLLAASESSKAMKHLWVSLLKRQYGPQLTFAMAIPFFQQLTGMNVIVFYALVLFKTIGFGANASLMSAMIIGVAMQLPLRSPYSPSTSSGDELSF
ncbi:hypothetical protein ACSQ67_012821 [Phaseolus vulgaris]